MKHVLRIAAVAVVLVLASCRDDTTAPGAGDPPAGFVVEMPPTVVRGEAFTLTVTAVDNAGRRDVSWQGTVALNASGGTVSPGTVQLVDGGASVQATLTGHVGDVTVTAVSGSVQSEPAAAIVLSGAAPARLEVEPGAALLTDAGQTRAFEVRAFDAQGAPTTAPQVTWTSNDPASLSIDANGVATAQAGAGSAMVVATANGMESAPAVVLIAQPATGAVLLADSQIVSAPSPVDPAASYEPGWQYRVRVRGAPAAGTIVIGSGERPLAGRVAAVTAFAGGESDLTVELLPLDQLFDDLRIRESIPMIEQTAAAGDAGPGGAGVGGMAAGVHGGMVAYGAGRADTEFKLGRFDCTASGSLPSLDLPDPTLDIDGRLLLEIGYENGLDRLAVTGTLSADAGYRPVFEATFEGDVKCETELKTYTIPAQGLISLFYGVQIPLGVGFELDGKLDIAQVGFDIQADASATVELGLSCPGGGSCSGLTKFDVTRDGSLEFIAPAPSEQFRVQLGAHAFLFARPFLGSLFTKSLSFEFVDATAGLKQSVDLAATQLQVDDTAYASSFDLRFLAGIGPGEDLQNAIDRIGKLLGTDLSASLTLLEVDDTLATSPKGTFTITPSIVQPGDSTQVGQMATFTVDLDPVTYLGLSSVEKVEFLWEREMDDSTGLTLQPGRPSCMFVTSGSGQTKFECSTDFLDEHEGNQTFHAFVHAKLFGVPLPVPLEISADAHATVKVGDCVRLTPLTVKTQAAVDSLADVCELLLLTLTDSAGSGDPIVDLSPLDSLHLRFGFQVVGTSLTNLAGLETLTFGEGAGIGAAHNPNLVSLEGLPTSAARLDSLGGIRLEGNPLLRDISALANIIAPGAAVHTVRVADNASLTSLAGLENIGSVTDQLMIFNSPALSSLTALTGLRGLPGRSRIRETGLTRIDFPSLDVVGPEFVVELNPLLTDIDIAIDSVIPASQTNGIFFQANNALRNVSINVAKGAPDIRLHGLPALAQLAGTIGSRTAGHVSIANTALTSIAAFDLGAADYLYIENNASLVNIDAFRNLNHVTYFFMINYNPALCVPAWVYQVNAGSRTVLGNNTSCQ